MWLNKSGDHYAAPSIYLLSGFFPFNTGEKVFFRACMHPEYSKSFVMNNMYVWGINTYFDYDINRTVYPALGKKSAQYFLVVPE
jgi:hypothetical protein